MREIRDIIKVVHNLVLLCDLVLLCVLSGAVLISADSPNNSLKSASLGLANSGLILAPLVTLQRIQPLADLATV